MGSTFAYDLASGDYVSNLRQQLSIHLSSNHYPPVPNTMIDPCVAAIEAGNEDDFARLIDLPEGVTYRGSSQASAGSIIENHHLEFWLEGDE